MKDFFEWLSELIWYYWFECIIAFFVSAVLVFILYAVNSDTKKNMAERKEFMAYCTQKGYSGEDCKWEWKRIENGKKSDTFVIIPMFFGGGH